MKQDAAGTIPSLCIGTSPWRWMMLLAIVFISTNRLDYVTDHEQIVVGAGDILSYFEISKAAPGFIETPVPYHHAQRVFLPYAIGLLSKGTGISIYNAYWLVGACLLATAFWYFLRCVELLGIREESAILVSFVVLMNPYLFRHLLMFNGYINDIGFLAAGAMILFGILSENRGLIVVAIVFSALSRQTTLLILPAIVVLEYLTTRSRKWRCDLVTISYFVLPMAIYIVTALIAKRTGLPSETKDALFGLFVWFKNDFSAARLMEFAIRGLIPFTFIIALFVSFYGSSNPDRARRSVMWALLFLVASICIQPILGGPYWTTNSIARLNALAVFPAALAVGLYIDRSSAQLNLSALIGVGALLTIGSMHHIYSYNGAFSADKNTWFVLIQLLSALVMIAVIRHSAMTAKRIGNFVPENSGNGQIREIVGKIE